MTEMQAVKVDDLFEVQSGDFHAASELDAGNVPLISCGDVNSGLMGHYDIPQEKTYHHAITVAYNGSWPLTAKFHPYKFAAKDDVAVLIPKKPMKDTTQLYVATLLNKQVWRYSYGRKCFRAKLRNLKLTVPVIKHKDDVQIDEQAIAKVFSVNYRDYIPEKTNARPIKVPTLKWQSFNILELLNLDRGDFHSIANLDPGEFMTVSRTSDDNGKVGYYDLPDGATVYSRGLITVSTVGGDAFVQLNDFIATDNVVVCTPKTTLRTTTLFFLAFMLNQQKWRYGYGRQCYQAKLERVNIDLPVKGEKQIDEAAIERIVKQSSYWPIVGKRFPETITFQQKQGQLDLPGFD
jgi:hypothetical protein